ncbi:MAG: hypothetical protein AAGF11_52225 [Myxococcota bacterium]
MPFDRPLSLQLASTLTLALAACGPLSEDPTFDELPVEDYDELEPTAPDATLDALVAPVPSTADLLCIDQLRASVGGLYYPGWDCADALADAESNLASWHYRNGCHQQVGSDLATPVDQASVAECHIEGDSAVVTVDLCCAEPAFLCDPSLQASVGGLYYPGWDCAAAIADAESNLASWHYRNGCNEQVGSDLGTPVDQASVAECHIEGDSAVVSVDLCCAEPDFCHPDLQATVGGLYYPGWDCATAIADAESNLASWHYRNGCHQQVGSNLGTPVNQASVAQCHIEGNSAVVTVDLCCT